MISSDDKATSEWLNAQKKGTRKTYKNLWLYFLEFTGITGDQILENRKADMEYSWEKKVLEFKRWLIEKKAKSETTGKIGAAVVRGFFAYHRQPLQFRRQESAQLGEAKRKTEDYRFSRDDLKRMADVGDLNEKYIVTAGKSFGLRAGDFLRLAKGDLEPYISNPVPISIGEYGTQKEKVKAFPFIDSDAEPVIKAVLDNMTRQGRTNPNNRILTYKDEIQLSRVLQRLADKAGINYGNKNVRFHCLRKFLIDRLASHMSESKWKQIVGKKISEGAYVSPDSLREDYARAMAETTFTKATTEGEIELLAKKEALKMLAKMQGISEEEMKKIFRSKKAMTTAEEVRILEEITEKPKTTTNGGCADGVHCGEQFEQINESQFLQYLRDGWQIVLRLSNGDVIVKR